MKRWLLITWLIFLAPMMYAQEWRGAGTELKKHEATDDQFNELVQQSKRYHYNGLNDSLRLSSFKLLELAQQQHSDLQLAEAYNWIANYFDNTGNYALSLQFHFKSLNIAEHLGTIESIARSKSNIAWSYIHLGDFRNAIIFSKKAISDWLSLPGKDERLVAAYDNLAIAFLGLEKADSALRYTQLANAVNIQVNNQFEQSYIFFQLGRCYQLMKEYALAETFFMKSISFSSENHNLQPLSMSATSLGELLLQQDRNDEARQICWAGLEAARAGGYNRQLIDNAEILQSIYERLNETDSAYKYLKMATVYRDIVFNEQRRLQVQNVIFTQQLYEKETEQEKLLAETERRHRLQYAAISFGLVFFILLYLVLSYSVIATEKIIRFLGVLSLLIVFEFINLLIHPYIGNITHHSPLLMLISMVCIAALLIPIHHWLEHWITDRLVEKNNRIRLEAARKALEELEGLSITSMAKKQSRTHN